MTVEITPHGRGYRLVSQQTLTMDVGDVFPFFADARNLEALTPSRLRFQILSPQPIRMRPGTLIDYRLRVHGLPLHWQSEITAWDPPHRFVDEQRRGPYRFWRHEHRFLGREGTTLVEDIVEYAVPGGRIVHGLLVERDLRHIFGFRRKALAAHFAAQPIEPISPVAKKFSPSESG